MSLGRGVCGERTEYDHSPGLSLPPSICISAGAPEMSRDFQCPAFDRRGWASPLHLLTRGAASQAVLSQRKLIQARIGCASEMSLWCPWTSLSSSSSARGIIRLHFLGQAGLFPHLCRPTPTLIPTPAPQINGRNLPASLPSCTSNCWLAAPYYLYSKS